MAILLGIVCLYSLSFNIITYNVEKKAKEFAKGDEAKEKAYLDSMATEKVYPLLGLTYQQVKSKEINLGLDLKGGMNVTMEISLAELTKSLAGNTSDENFNKALSNAQTQMNAGGKDFIALFVSEYEKLVPNGKLADFFANQDNVQQLKATASNSEVKSYLSKEANSAIDRSFIILRSRIDGFGVVSPNMQKQEGSNRIFIEMPGIQDKERVRKLLQGSAELQFWQVYQSQEVYPVLENINKTLALTVKDTVATKATADTTAAKGGKLAGLTKGASSTAATKDTSATALAAEAQKTNPLFAVLVPPVYQGENGQPQLMPGAVVGSALQKDTAKVNAMLARPEIKSLVPTTMKFMWGLKPRTGTKAFELYAIKSTSLDGRPDLSGDAVANARDGYDQNNNPDVTMFMTSEGASKWKKMTAEAAADPNNKKAIAIVLDNTVYSAPTVQNEIPNGVSSITGSFTKEDTKDLANVLKAGKLPAPAKIVSDFVVGPSLGQQAIDSGLLSFVLAFVVILAFMAFYYNKAGWVANIALLINVFFIMGVLAAFGAVLTLPGIAGIVLTIGLSVDANILIFERVREELALGKSTNLAIREGFKHAMSSILDSNITVFILGVILFVFGSGPVQGFATTLCVGIVTSLFAAVLISRLIFESMMDKKANITFDNNITRGAFKNLAFNFVGRRKLYYIISAVIIVAGTAMYFKNDGLHLGVDFKGGRTYMVKFDKQLNTEEVAKTLSENFEGEEALVKTIGTDNSLKITTPYHITDQAPDADKVVETALRKGLDGLGAKYTIESSQKVTPTIASDIITSAVYAVLFSCLVMFIYILVRFKKWQYGLGAVIALFHDVLLAFHSTLF
ncbi:protein translocase subunit SecDF [Pedobacter sp. SL55]|uniref:protein translocase subunit SecDF n=1 Tax=Pedobacter sp. SL55 TaxID=2995161 RepID=UPI002D1E3529|nr:protein translocase subunit SecDF [Pedobacter sp. SL55]